MNRAQRRLQSKTLQGKANELLRMADDMEKEYRKGAIDAERHAIKMIFAALCLVLKHYFKFGRIRIYRVLKAVEAYLQPNNLLSSMEMIDKVLEETGIRLNFDDPFDPVEMIEEKRKK